MKAGVLALQGDFREHAAMFYAVVIVIANLVIDVMYAVTDPRVRYR